MDDEDTTSLPIIPLHEHHHANPRPHGWVYVVTCLALIGMLLFGAWLYLRAHQPPPFRAAGIWASAHQQHCRTWGSWPGQAAFRHVQHDLRTLGPQLASGKPLVTGGQKLRHDAGAALGSPPPVGARSYAKAMSAAAAAGADLMAGHLVRAAAHLDQVSAGFGAYVKAIQGCQ